MLNDQLDMLPVPDDFIELLGGAPAASVPMASAPHTDKLVVSGYQATREDIEILARELFREAQLLWWGTFIGSVLSDLAKYDYFPLMRRLADIRNVIGDKAVQQIMDEVNRELGYKLGVETWRVFTTGSQPERDALRQQLKEDGDRCGMKARDHATPVAAAEYLRQHPSGVFTDSEGDLWYLSELTDGEHDGLVLKIVGPTGQAIRAHEFVFDRPPGWFRPYGLS
jgi:hypothetical protein